MPDALRLAVGTLTTWRVPPPSRIDAVVAGWAMTIAPVVLLPLLAILGVGSQLADRLGVPPLVVGVLVIAGLVLSTRAMHLDGLADTCDGLSASYDRDRALEIMRRGDTGPSGAAGIALVLALQVAGAFSLVRSPAGLLLFAVAVLASRHTLAWGCRHGVPAARPEGLGATMAGSVPRARLAAAFLVLIAASALAGVATGQPWWSGPLVVASAVLAQTLLVRRATSRLGGMTGDVLGAGIEVSLACGLAVAATVLVA
jgi:adenosylcobinamide-GDP ribazoletransferase